MSDTIEHPFPSIDMAEIGKVIHKLHEQVSHKRHRIEVTRSDNTEVCVMISKSELESLESTLAILADTDAFNDMCRNLQEVLKTAGVVYYPQSAE